MRAVTSDATDERRSTTGILRTARRKLRREARLAIFAITTLPVVTTACAIPLSVRGSREILTGYAAQSARGEAWRRVVPGLDVRLAPGRSGMTLGWSDTRMVVLAPRGEAAGVAPRCARSWLPPLGTRWCASDGSQHALGSFFTALPDASNATAGRVFTHAIAAGAYVDAGAAGTSAGIGVSSRTRITLPARSSLAALLSYDSRAPLAARLLERKDGSRANP